jgi:predicted transcriptional regulator
MSEETPTPPTLVRDLMSIGVLTCSPDTPLVQLTRILLERDLEGAVVLDEQGHATGIVDLNDLIRAYSAGEYADLTVESVMQDGVPQIPPDIPLTAAAQIMQDKGLRVVFLMHHAGGIEYPAAMLSYKNMLRHMSMESEDELSDLGVEAARELPLETFLKRRQKARNQVGHG